MRRGRRVQARGGVEHTPSTIEAAFGDAPRPPDGELLRERCFDHDIVALDGVPLGRELDATVEREYAAPWFLSAAGSRHFVPAYNARQCAAAAAFLEAARETAEAELAPAWWRARG